MKIPFWKGHQGQTYTQEGADGIHKDNDLLKNVSWTSESVLGYPALLPHKKLCFFVSLTDDVFLFLIVNIRYHCLSILIIQFFYFTAGLAYSDKNLDLNSNTGSFGPRLGQLFWQSHKETQSINVTQKIVKRLPVRAKCFSDKSMTPGKSSFTNNYECFSERKQLDYK